MPAVESAAELLARITYYLSPGPKSWTDRPGIWPAMSMNAEEPARCSASPLIAWIDAGTSRTLWALSLLAVTTISSIGADSPAVSAATAGAPVSTAVTPAPTASMQLETLCFFIEWSPVARRSIVVSPVLFEDNMSYHMKYQVYAKVLRAADMAARAGSPCYRVILRLMRRIIAKAVVSSCGVKPFSRRCWRRRTRILRELNSVRPLSVRNTST